LAEIHRELARRERLRLRLDAAALEEADDDVGFLFGTDDFYDLPVFGHPRPPKLAAGSYRRKAPSFLMLDSHLDPSRLVRLRPIKQRVAFPKRGPTGDPAERPASSQHEE